MKFIYLSPAYVIIIKAEIFSYSCSHLSVTFICDYCLLSCNGEHNGSLDALLASTITDPVRLHGEVMDHFGTLGKNCISQ